MKNELKLYVWEDVLGDYSTGMVVVLARSREHAWKLLKAGDMDAYERIADLGYDYYGEKKNGENKVEPREVTKPEVFIKYGGG